MNRNFALSEVSKTRLKKHNRFSLICFALAIVLASLAPQPWFPAIALYFLIKFLHRIYLLKTVAPYLNLSGDGLTVRWSRSNFIPWSEVTEIIDASEHTIAIMYQPESGTKARTIHIIKWRVEIGPEELLLMLREYRDQAADHVGILSEPAANTF